MNLVIFLTPCCCLLKIITALTNVPRELEATSYEILKDMLMSVSSTVVVVSVSVSVSVSTVVTKSKS